MAAGNLETKKTRSLELGIGVQQCSGVCMMSAAEQSIKCDFSVIPSVTLSRKS